MWVPVHVCTQVCVTICVQVFSEARRSLQMPWSWSYKSLVGYELLVQGVKQALLTPELISPAIYLIILISRDSFSNLFSFHRWGEAKRVVAASKLPMELSYLSYLWSISRLSCLTCISWHLEDGCRIFVCIHEYIQALHLMSSYLPAKSSPIKVMLEKWWEANWPAPNLTVFLVGLASCIIYSKRWFCLKNYAAHEFFSLVKLLEGCMSRRVPLGHSHQNSQGLLSSSSSWQKKGNFGIFKKS